MATSSQTSTPEPKRWSSEVNKVRLTLLIALLFTTLGAGVFRTPSLMLMTALLMGMPLVGIIVSRIASRSLTVSRHLPASGIVGDTISGDITVRNNARWPLFMVHLRSGEAIYQEADKEVAAVIPVDDEDSVAPVIRGRNTSTWRQNWRLQRRGVFQLSPARAGVLDPIGLYTRLPIKTAAHQLTVLPRAVPVSQLSFLGSITAGKQLPQYATAVADATDFHGVRPWRPGEGLRRVHWKNTARTGQLHVVEWEEALASDTSVILDTQSATIAGEGANSTLEVAITLAATIASYLLENGYQFELFHWEQLAATSEPKLRLPLKLRTSQNATTLPSKIQHFQGRNASDARAALQALAQIQAVQSADATLPHLCEQAGPLLSPARSILIIASSLADVQKALHRLEASVAAGVACQALLLDADSFSITTDVTVPAHIEHSPTLSRQMRVVRRGDSLATVLERQW